MSLIEKKLAGEILDEALSTGGDWAEVFVEDRTDETIVLQEKQVKKINSSLSKGIGIRVFKDDYQIYAYTNVLDRENLLKTARKAAEGIKGKRLGSHKIDLVDYEVKMRHSLVGSSQKQSKNERVELLRQISDFAYGVDQRIVQVTENLASSQRKILVANSDGLWVEDQQDRTRLGLMAMAERENVKESSYRTFGLQGGIEIFEQIPEGIKSWSEKVSSQAVANTFAQKCPVGKMPVIIANGNGGVIFHEACGHSLEASHVAKGNSEFYGKMGQKVASDLVTAYDDGLPENLWGSTNIDDEGTPSQRRLLIEKGILKGYMADKFYGKKMGMASTGSGRREDYTFMPTSRMSNTYIENGTSSKEDIIAATDYALYAVSLPGGSVNTTTGDFNFSVSEGYLIRNGKIAEPVKGAKLIGKGIEVLQKIDMVGNDLKLSSGTCGAASGQIPVSIGQPTIRVAELTVGGQE